MSSNPLIRLSPPVPFEWLNPAPGAAHPVYPLGPPADFGGAIIPNPDNLRVLPDTEGPADQLTQGKTSTDNFQGKTPLRKVAAQSGDWFDQNAPKPTTTQASGDWFDQNAPKGDAAPPPPGLWDKVKSFFNDDSLSKQARDNYEKVHGKVEMPGSGEGANLMQNLSDWDHASGGELGGGVHDILKGDVAKGLHRIIGGASAASLPVIALTGPAAIARAPVTAALSAGGSVVGGKAARSGAEALGATPDQAQLAEDIGNIGGGYGGAKLPGITDHPAFQKAFASLGQSVKPAVRAAARTASDIVDPELTGVISPRAAHAQRVLGRVADALEDSPQTKGAPIERDATLDQRNIPEFAGEEKPPLVDMQDRLAKQIAANRNATNFTAADRLKAKSLLTDSLKSSTGDVIDQVVPGKNAAVKSRVEFYLKKGDVAGAEAALDKGAKAWKNLDIDRQAQAQAAQELGSTSDPQFLNRSQELKEQMMSAAGTNKPAWTALDRQPVPSTNEIRARVQREAKAPKPGSRADLMEDKGIDQQWQWHLERHGWAAESEARREFIARNSTGMTKGELAKRFAATRSGSAAQTAPGQAAAPGTAAAALPENDLTSILQKSLDAVRKAQK